MPILQDVGEHDDAEGRDAATDLPLGIRGVSHLVLNVRSVATSEPWYVDLFGMVPFLRGTDDEPFVALYLKPARLTITLTEVPGADAPFVPGRTGLDHLALDVVTGSELDAWAERCEALGVDHDPVVDEEGGGRSLMLRDPDGIVLELYARR